MRRPSPDTIAIVKKSNPILKHNVENILQDFHQVSYQFSETCNQEFLDALFMMFTYGMVAAMDPKSTFNINYVTQLVGQKKPNAH